MKSLLTSLILLFITACNGSDYSVQGELRQKVNGKNVDYIIIECYCDNGVDIDETDSDIISINVVGKLESIGYHGDQEVPKEVRKETLSFITAFKNDTLRLISKEWTHIHHSYLIDELSIQIPEGMNYQLVKINGGELEGREIE